MYTYNEIEAANSQTKGIDVKGKNYIEVNQRIKAFRMICPCGGITTEMLSNESGICVFKATVFDENGQILGTGTAYEKESSSFINKTSYIENCETSAVGRALGMCGFGIDTSIASYEEVTNAINNQSDDMTYEQALELTLEFGQYKGKKLRQIWREDIEYIKWLANGDKTETRIKTAISIISEHLKRIKEEKAQMHSELEAEMQDMLENEG